MIPTGTPRPGASNADGVGQKRDSGRIAGCIGHVFIGAYSIYCVTLIGVFLGHFRIKGGRTLCAWPVASDVSVMKFVD